MKKLISYINQNHAAQFGDLAHRLNFNRGWKLSNPIIKFLWWIDNSINELDNQSDEYICPIRQAQLDYESAKMESKYNTDEWVEAQRNA
tara:strand:+ start:439 stop:705 length:267 start_codon:yes stop_codon:yes gene_type:complete